jgi:hypothetical protein
MLIVKWFRYLTYVAALVSLFVIIDIGVYYFTIWAFDKALNILNWAWWKVALLGIFGLIGLQILWRLIKIIVAFIISLCSYISPLIIINAWTSVILTVINFLFLMYQTWFNVLEYSWTQVIINLVSTYIIFQLTWSFYVGATSQINSINSYYENNSY